MVRRRLRLRPGGHRQPQALHRQDPDPLTGPQRHGAARLPTLVITSYSIHYTKLYEAVRAEAPAGRAPDPRLLGDGPPGALTNKITDNVVNTWLILAVQTHFVIPCQGALMKKTLPALCASLLLAAGLFSTPVLADSPVEQVV